VTIDLEFNTRAELGPGNWSEAEVGLVDLTRRMVATPSPSGEEREVASILAAELAGLGYRDIEIDDNYNVTAYSGSGPPRLMFNGHIDHVPPAGMEDPFDPRIFELSENQGRRLAIRGRGTCDMKSNVAAGAYAVAFLDPDLLTRGSYLFTADAQEETDSPLGVPSLLERGIRADFGLSGESTSLDVYLGHRGKIQVDVIVSGRSSHASTPHDGLNAVYRATPFLKAFEEFPGEMGEDPTYGRGSITVTGISSDPGSEVAVVPDTCTIRLDRRYVPGETPEGCERQIIELVDRISRDTGIEADVRLVNIYPLMSIDPDHKLVQDAVESVTEVTGARPDLKAWRFGVNATFMSEAGIPSIGIGPGNEDFAHTAEEHVPVDDLIGAAKIYGNLIERVCGGKDD
jgi:succinyl-diaminopimelate desuccinylase